jgi:hypothetical protein
MEICTAPLHLSALICKALTVWGVNSELSESERLAQAINQDLYARYKKEFIDIYQGRPSFKVPVIRIKTSEGESTYASFPPYIPTCLEMVVSKKEVKQAGGALNLPIPVPQSYEDPRQDSCD